MRLQVEPVACIVTGAMQAVLDMLGGSFDGIMDANLLPWAQLAWGAGGVHADTSVAASLVQRLDWQEMAFNLPGAHCLSLHTTSPFQHLPAEKTRLALQVLPPP